MSEAPLLAIVVETTIEAPPAHVWDVLTSEVTLPRWLGAMDYRAVVGTTFFMQEDPALRSAHDTSGATHCTILAMDAPGKFVFSWFQPGTPETVVEFHLFPTAGGGTQLRLIHDGWDQFVPDAVRGYYEQVAEDWRATAVPALKRAASR